MAVMQVRIVSVPVGQPAMSVRVTVGLRADGIRMVVLVVLVVNMHVVMFRGFVLVEMQVPFRKMQPKADSHQRATGQERQSHVLA